MTKSENRAGSEDGIAAVDIADARLETLNAPFHGVAFPAAGRHGSGLEIQKFCPNRGDSLQVNLRQSRSELANFLEIHQRNVHAHLR